MSARSELLKKLREDVHRPLSKGDIFQKFDIAKEQQQMFSDLLDDLIKSGQIFKNSHFPHDVIKGLSGSFKTLSDMISNLLFTR